MKYRDKKKKALKGALKKAQDVRVVNKVELADKPMPKPKPTLRLTSNDLSEVASWDVKGKYTLQLEVKMTSKRQGAEYEFDENESDETHATFKVLSVEAYDE